MKTKSMTYVASLFLALVVLISFACNKPKPSGDSNENPSIDSTTAKASKTEKSIPVSSSEYATMKGLREFIYTIESAGEYYSPVFNDPYISVPEFNQYLINQNQGDVFDGIRIYPAMKRDIIMPVLCLGKSTSNEEKGYMILENAFYFQPNSLPGVNDAIIFETAQNLHQINYLIDVKIYRKNQTPPPTIDTIRYSRIHKIADIKKLIADNIASGPYTESELFLKFETGYIDSKLAQVFFSRLNPPIPPTLKASDLQGFTSIITLIDKNGNAIIDPKLRAGNPSNYTRLYLEVGVPCPPRCGTLHL